MGKEEDRIAEIEAEIKRTQVNKRTEYHLCRLRARLSELREKVAARPSSKCYEPTFELPKTGSARIGLFGFPSVGKSSFLNKVTNASSEVASYEFTTLSCIPGTLVYGGAVLQFLDLPGIIEAASQGKGKGKQVLAALRSCDLVLMFLNAKKPFSDEEGQTAGDEDPSEFYLDRQKKVLVDELLNANIRINRAPPNIEVNRKHKGLLVSSSPPVSKELEREIEETLLNDFKIHNAEIKIKEQIEAIPDEETGVSALQEVLDAVQGNKTYTKCLFVYNKIESAPLARTKRILAMKDSVAISCKVNINVDNLIKLCWKKLGIIRVFTKSGKKSDFKSPVILSVGETVKELCAKLHSSFVAGFKFAQVWGKSVKFQPQRVGLNHVLQDLDVVKIIK